MSDNWTDLSPYQRLSSAWNEIKNASQDVSETQNTRLASILEALNAVILDVLPLTPSDPVPLNTEGILHRGGREYGV